MLALKILLNVLDYIGLAFYILDLLLQVWLQFIKFLNKNKEKPNQDQQAGPAHPSWSHVKKREFIEDIVHQGGNYTRFLILSIKWDAQTHLISQNQLQQHETGSQQTDFTKGHNNKLISDLCTHLTDQCTFSAPTGTVGADVVGVSARKASQKVTDCEYTHSVTTGNQLSFTVTLKHQTIGSQKGRIKHWHVS